MVRVPVRANLKSIACGLTGWLTFQCYARRSALFSEYFLYAPIGELSLSQGWTVETEVHIGDQKRLDFLLSKGDKQVAIEVKWLPHWKKKADLQADLDKLTSLKRRWKTNPITVLLVAGPEEVLTEGKNTPDDIRMRIRNANNRVFPVGSDFATFLTCNRTSWGTALLEVAGGCDAR